MSHKKTKEIPVLKASGYHRVYFKHGVESQMLPFSMPAQYVEVRNRCLWNDVIEAHRLDFYIIFLTTEGQGRQTLGLNEYTVAKDRLGFIGPNVISAWRSQSETQCGYFIAFSEEFYASFYNQASLSQLPFFQLDGQAILKLSEDEIAFYRSLFQMMEAEYNAGQPMSKDVIRGLLHALLNKALSRDEGVAGNTQQHAQRGIALLKAFRELYIADISSIRSGIPILHRKISEYASMMAITPSHLNDTVKKLTGQSANQLIHNQLAKQASMCLLRSDKSIAELSYLLGFDDSAYFSRFYRAQTGKSPTEFRTHGSEKYRTFPVVS